MNKLWKCANDEESFQWDSVGFEFAFEIYHDGKLVGLITNTSFSIRIVPGRNDEYVRIDGRVFVCVYVCVCVRVCETRNSTIIVVL